MPTGATSIFYATSSDSMVVVLIRSCCDIGSIFYVKFLRELPARTSVHVGFRGRTTRGLGVFWGKLSNPSTGEILF